MPESAEKKALELAQEIDMGISAHMQGELDKQGIYEHPDWNWASELPHPCKRKQVYSRTLPHERKPKTVDSLFRLEEGIKKEDEMVDLLAKAGYRVKLAQERLRWEEFKISGRIDGALFKNGDEFPTEVKSISPWFWDSTKTLTAIREHSKFWIKQIPNQLNLYLFMKNKPAGILITCTFGARPRIIPMPIDYELGERDLKTAEEVNAHVANGTLPDRIEYDSSICGLCDFNATCQPITIADLTDITQEQANMIKEYLDLKEAKKRHDALHRKLIGDSKKPGLFHGKNAFFEDIEISTNTYPQKWYDVPADLKEKYKKERTITRTTIGRTG